MCSKGGRRRRKSASNLSKKHSQWLFGIFWSFFVFMTASLVSCWRRWIEHYWIFSTFVFFIKLSITSGSLFSLRSGWEKTGKCLELERFVDSWWNTVECETLSMLKKNLNFFWIKSWNTLKMKHIQISKWDKETVLKLEIFLNGNIELSLEFLKKFIFQIILHKI